MHYQLIKCLLQADLSKKESQIADLQENIKSQQAETFKAKEELTGALTDVGVKTGGSWVGGPELCV